MFVDAIDVHNALANHEMVACFQPLVELRTGRLAGFEVLARWRHAGHGLILPENFVSLAEEQGYIGQLTQQVLEEAFLSAPVLPEPLMLAVNISPSQLQDKALAARIHSIAERTGFPLSQLTIELTEHALLPNLKLAQATAQDLKMLGCRLALDDFGTGYSGLFHLQALPFDELKIDASFVRTMVENRESRKIVAAIVGLGYSLELLTVAEGIETEEQAELLLRLGCDLGQGWLYGRAQAAESLPAIIAGRPPARLAGARKLEEIRPGAGLGASLEALPAQRLAQLAAIYDGAPVGLCFLDRNLRYISLNQRLADLHGAPVAAHLGRTVEQMNPELFRMSEEYLLRALRGEAITGVEAPRPARAPARGDTTMLLSYQPARDEDGEVIGVSVALMDITARKAAEQALRASELDRH